MDPLTNRGQYDTITGYHRPTAYHRPRNSGSGSELSGASSQSPDSPLSPNGQPIAIASLSDAIARDALSLNGNVQPAAKELVDNGTVSSELIPAGDERHKDEIIQDILHQLALKQSGLPIFAFRDPKQIEENMKRVTSDANEAVAQRKKFAIFNFAAAAAASITGFLSSGISVPLTFITSWATGRVSQSTLFEKAPDAFSKTNTEEREKIISHMQSAFKILGHNHINSYLVAKYGKDGIFVPKEKTPVCIQNLKNIVAIAKAILAPARLNLIKEEFLRNIPSLTNAEIDHVLSPLKSACQVVLKDEGSFKEEIASDNKFYKFYVINRNQIQQKITELKQQHAEQEAQESRLNQKLKEVELQNKLLAAQQQQQIDSLYASFQEAMKGATLNDVAQAEQTLRQELSAGLKEQTAVTSTLTMSLQATQAVATERMAQIEEELKKAQALAAKQQHQIAMLTTQNTQLQARANRIDGAIVELTYIDVVRERSLRASTGHRSGIPTVHHHPLTKNRTWMTAHTAPHSLPAFHKAGSGSKKPSTSHADVKHTAANAPQSATAHREPIASHPIRTPAAFGRIGKPTPLHKIKMNFTQF